MLQPASESHLLRHSSQKGGLRGEAREGREGAEPPCYGVAASCPTGLAWGPAEGPRENHGSRGSAPGEAARLAGPWGCTPQGASLSAELAGGTGELRRAFCPDPGPACVLFHIQGPSAAGYVAVFTLGHRSKLAVGGT